MIWSEEGELAPVGNSEAENFLRNLAAKGVTAGERGKERRYLGTKERESGEKEEHLLGTKGNASRNLEGFVPHGGTVSPLYSHSRTDLEVNEHTPLHNSLILLSLHSQRLSFPGMAETQKISFALLVIGTDCPGGDPETALHIQQVTLHLSTEP